jgi:Zn-dependent protease with chaperone function
LKGLPPGLSTFQWISVGTVRMPIATGAALLSTWTAVLFALWVGVYSAIGSVLVLLTGTVVSGHSTGVFDFTAHSGTSLDVLAVLAALFGGFGLGFADSYTTSLTSGVADVAFSLLAGIVIGMVIGLIAMRFEEVVLHGRGYRRPSKREWNTHLESAIEVVQDAMGLQTVPRFMVADTPVPLAWTISRHVVVSTGLMQNLDAAELQAVIAHELAHWRRGDAIALRMVWAFSWPIAALYNIGMILSGAQFGKPETAAEAARSGQINKNFLSFLGWFFLWPSYVLMRYVIGPCTAAGSREMEYEADAAVVRAGLGSGLARALERLEPFEPPRTAWEAVLSSSHPPTQLRLEAIQELDPDSEEPDIERVTKAESGAIFVLVAVLLVVGLAHLLPAHPHHTSWWNPFGGF